MAKAKKKLAITRTSRFDRFVRDVFIHTPFLKMVFLLIIMWMLFSACIYFAEFNAEDAIIDSYGKALYWGIAAFSTAGIADTPKSGVSLIVGGIWIVLGSILFFGTIVATVTTYFMRPLHRPSKQIIDTIEYNLERLDDLSIEELDLLKKTTDSLIIHVESLKKKHSE
jgi:voltage-gated potassium channel